MKKGGAKVGDLEKKDVERRVKIEMPEKSNIPTRGGPILLTSNNVEVFDEDDGVICVTFLKTMSYDGHVETRFLECGDLSPLSFTKNLSEIDRLFVQENGMEIESGDKSPHSKIWLRQSRSRENTQSTGDSKRFLEKMIPVCRRMIESISEATATEFHLHPSSCLFYSGYGEIGWITLY